MEKLVISDDEGKTTVVPLVRDVLTLGRGEGNTIRLTERNVSRRHACIRRNGAGYAIEDLDSYNGVRVNGRLIDEVTPLSPGDRVGIGDYVLSLEDEAVDAAAPPDRRTTARHARYRSADPPPSDAAEALRDTKRERPVPSAMPAPPARLVLLTPPAPGAEFALSRPRLRVGRSEDLDIWINHKSISRVHATIDVEDGRFEITDAESANGVRVNGERVGTASLRPGDIVDLGQVRLRFVAPGEAYRFDLDRTVELAASEGAPRRGVHPVVVGLVLFGAMAVSSVVGLALSRDGGPLADWGRGGSQEARGVPGAVPSAPVARAPAADSDGAGGAPPPATATTTGPADDAPAAAQPGTPGEGESTPGDGDAPAGDGEAPAGDPGAADEAAPGAPSEAAVACRDALADDLPEEALAIATRALVGAPEDEAVQECGEQARVRLADQRVFARGLAALAAGDVEGAHFAFGGLSEDSQLRDRPEVTRARTRFAERRLDLVARTSLRSPQMARRQLQVVLEMEQLPTALRRRAQQLARGLRRNP